MSSNPYLFPAPPQACVRVQGESAMLPVHRIYCVGRNFAEHAKEMGAEVPARGTPVFFMKPADAVEIEGKDIPYPGMTNDLHHEVELVVALDRDAHGVIGMDSAEQYIFGYGVGLDLTRRDLQNTAKEKRLPWDTSKGFDYSAPLSAIIPKKEIRNLEDLVLSLQVNDVMRQRAPLSDMVFNVAEIIHELSKLYRLKAGDLIFMGTPSGVAALQP
ncbi:MAG: fumarylacetoacetate hydrolase family protein, partial [Arenimonas sp.]